MIYAVIAIAVAVAFLTAYVFDRFAKTWTNMDALNHYAIASFERLVELEAIIDDCFETTEEDDDDEA